MRIGLIAVGLIAVHSLGCGGPQGPSTYSPEHSTVYRGSKLGPSSGDEKALLQVVPKLRTGKERAVGALRVVADVPYFAASGRLCRALIVRGASRQQGQTRLACKDEEGWFFAADVFGARPGR